MAGSGFVSLYLEPFVGMVMGQVYILNKLIISINTPDLSSHRSAFSKNYEHETVSISCPLLRKIAKWSSMAVGFVASSRVITIE